MSICVTVTHLWLKHEPGLSDAQVVNSLEVYFEFTSMLEEHIEEQPLTSWADVLAGRHMQRGDTSSTAMGAQTASLKKKIYIAA